MFQLFKSAESKRIESLFNRYKELIAKGHSDEQARTEIISEWQVKSAPSEIARYDISELVNFIIKWEFTGKYNYMPTIEQIRSGNHPQAKLEKNIRRIKDQIL